MENILNLLKQRRVWVSIIGVLMLFMNLFHKELNFDANELADKLTTFGVAVGDLVVATLAIHSYLRPRK